MVGESGGEEEGGGRGLVHAWCSGVMPEASRERGPPKRNSGPPEYSTWWNPQWNIVDPVEQWNPRQQLGGAVERFERRQSGVDAGGFEVIFERLRAGGAGWCCGGF